MEQVPDIFQVEFVGLFKYCIRDCNTQLIRERQNQLICSRENISKIHCFDREEVYVTSSFSFWKSKGFRS